jgi:hypothetical protein
MWTNSALVTIHDHAPVVGDDGTQYPGNWPKENIPGLERVSETAPPGSSTNVVTGYAIERLAGVPTQVWASTPVPLADLKATKLAALAARRYQAETGGLTYNGWPMPTDRDSQAKINAAYVLARDGHWAGGWKGEDGTYRLLTAEGVVELALVVAAHVQLCYAVEAEHAAAITALSDPAEVVAYDVAAGWPA